MSSPERAQPEYIEDPNISDEVRIIPYDFGTLRYKYELECRKQGKDTAPRTLNGAEVHPELEGTEFQIYEVPLGAKSHGHSRVLAGIKFTGAPEVTWASALQDIVVEAESAEEALEWLRLEAVIRSRKPEDALDRAHRLHEEREIGEVIDLIHGEQPAPAKQPRKGKKPLTKHAPA